MRLWQYGVGFSLALGLGFGLVAGCAAGGNQSTGSGGATTTGAGGTGTGTGGSGAGTISTTGAGGAVADAGDCAKFNAEATAAPAAIVFILDGSASMNKFNKWGTAQLAVIDAIDKDAFDSTSLGLLTFPGGFVNPPPCICSSIGLDQATCNFLLAPGVSCGVPFLAQIAVQPAGTNKSNATSGVRHDMYQYLVFAKPLSNSDDGSPIYDALVAGYNSLKLANIEKRIAVLITDGGFSCTSVASPPRPGDLDLNGCPDWEIPDTVNNLINGARTDPQKPINTFVVGVPESNSHGEKQGLYDTPQYSMLLALSTYAVSGSPETIDPSCDKDLVFSKTAGDPAKPCHYDLSNSATFNATTLADAITTLRRKALGCTYDLPTPPMGQTINKGQVNVVVTIDGTDYSIPKRKDASDMCLTDPCWDYNDKGQVELIGITCSTVSGANSAKVQIYVGCATIIK